MKLLFGNSLWHLLVQSDVMTKATLLLLLIMSIVCWTVIFYKWMQFIQKSKQLAQVDAYTSTINTADDLQRVTMQAEGLYGSYVLSQYVQALQEYGQSTKLLTDREFDVLDEARMGVVEEMVFQEWTLLPVLFVAASGSPLIGLFGTVWGLMNSFISISQKQSADIITVAPGIAEALLATLAGLMVAIPALIMYHYLSTYVRDLEHRLYHLSDKIALLAKKKGLFIPSLQ